MSAIVFLPILRIPSAVVWYFGGPRHSPAGSPGYALGDNARTRGPVLFGGIGKSGLLTFCAALLACAGHVPSSSTNTATAQPFTVSSVSTSFAIRGTFEGSVTIGQDNIEVEVSTARVLNSVHTRPAHRLIFSTVRVRAMLAGPDGDRWRILSESRATRLPDMVADTSQTLGPLRFVIRKPRGFDPRRTWLAFQFAARHVPDTPGYVAGQEEFTTYAHGSDYLGGGVTDRQP